MERTYLVNLIAGEYLMWDIQAARGPRRLHGAPPDVLPHVDAEHIVERLTFLHLKSFKAIGFGVHSSFWGRIDGMGLTFGFDVGRLNVSERAALAKAFRERASRLGFVFEGRSNRATIPFSKELVESILQDYLAMVKAVAA